MLTANYNNNNDINKNNHDCDNINGDNKQQHSRLDAQNNAQSVNTTVVDLSRLEQYSGRHPIVS